MIIHPAASLSGTVSLAGAKNAVLVSMASCLLVDGVSVLTNVPASLDVYQMIVLLESLGAKISFEEIAHRLTIDTTTVNQVTVSPEIMRKMRASVLVMGPLLARYQRAHIALPGGCLIGLRPIDYHLRGFAKMGAIIETQDQFLNATGALKATNFVLEYPSVGATENVMMAATLTSGTTKIINAALEPEVLDLIAFLRAMGAMIEITPPATISITGVSVLRPVEYAILPDRLEAGTLLATVAATGGSITIPDAPAYYMEVFLEKLVEMGHSIICGDKQVGITMVASKNPRAVSFKTMPYPGFPTDLQAPMMVLQTVACGESIISETVFENRLLHVRELQRMGAQITINGTTATIKGVDQLYGAQVIASDIRSSAALVIAGLIAQGQTVMAGIHHFRRGYDQLETKLQQLGAVIAIEQKEVW
jgi:UDP-N-acetylglucosamine 1-carboxyvinyltransferase